MMYGRFRAVPPSAFLLPAIGVLSASAPVVAQEAVSVEVVPSALSLEVGEEATLEARVLDPNGNEVNAEILFFPRFADGRNASARWSIDVDRTTGRVRAVKGGEFVVLAIVATAGNLRGEAAVSVAYPPLDRIDVTPSGGSTYVGVATRHRATLLDTAEDERDGEIRWSTSDADVATVDRFGILTAHASGQFALRAEAEGIAAEVAYEVRENPAARLTVTGSAERARTGDVVRFEAAVEDAMGGPVGDLPVTWTVTSDPSIEATADIPPAEIDEQGRFVAYFPGLYTVAATVPGRTSWGAAEVESSSLISRASIEVHPRHAAQEVTFVGQGQVNNERTSDLWVWEGVDGRDYAITGTHAAAGAVYFWDVTDPANPVLTDSVVVDARTTNDVKVSEDGEICVISREGASNRRNGIVILNCRNPRDVTTISVFDDELTGGVHNLFIHEDHVYAVNNGRRFDVINIEDPAGPHRVGRFELDTPGHAIHDIWIVDGIAYTSNWGDGVVLIDVGGGDRGGSPSNPVEIARFRDIGGRTHAAFPYRSPTGRFYVFMGDEAGRPGFDGQDPERTPQFMSGYIHVVDFTDPDNPEEVARYEIPEAGSHNMWIEDDKLYAAFYNGGLRVLDISGELKGNLGEQGREIARYMAYDPDGVVANAPFTWGPQIHKGNLFFAEYFSGLWAVKLQPRQELVP
ncbi:MAG: hypothetical protein F4164_08880 [Gemmatimonadales bacterium]|nr:hypothetical protein [Gemmatimonadales bacterium]MYG49462.1 hypothetical protein [Gemmatimonadales bacterium]MYK02014.1 hypothetical protein [Candidatus Palauibacter ramosifaciens]